MEWEALENETMEDVSEDSLCPMCHGPPCAMIQLKPT